MNFCSFALFDCQGDGTQQAIVVAMSSDGGTGGPDIHSIISRDSEGELEELQIAEVGPKTYDTLFGNRNLLSLRLLPKTHRRSGKTLSRHSAERFLTLPLDH